MLHFYAHGKLLITGEYSVLDGALALAVPTKKGQHLYIEPSDQNDILWESRDKDGKIWFETTLTYNEISEAQIANPEDPKQRLLQLLRTAQKLNPQFLAEKTALKITTRLEFDRNWGLGTSSTLVYMLAKWAQVNAYRLLELTFGGSGYDLACAGSETAILYQKSLGEPTVYQTTFNPPFSDQLFFVYLNKKQNSREAITNYRNQPKAGQELLKNKISGISETLLKCEDLTSFCMLINAHEQLIGRALNTTPIKQMHFSDYTGSIKSLGGWGGDFILATGSDIEQDYFRSKGYQTIIAFDEMVLD
ncbi:MULTISPECIES: GYDIA family GHMP kinase [unclassified Leeuwenhoekiella]|uniref:GYDIA family GHMP kinase n=1 Tax=unclassified Leeuwenhoekiella TaxID=2615029 RepID=UPI000C3DC764|nr:MULTISPECIES: GYDIA family GHMP kinase [unclassified Leeuwenhoekiella]MAW97170.1 GHMP kinase [Leeuwenhoekiella sp.]MBA82744.1 GHMP kinase [Leeuwenhoekiella sp.]|tara:strand:+ start:58747 stop:59661 length:915 start_codon:yes stop_codon:yes gene_type:complete